MHKKQFILNYNFVLKKLNLKSLKTQTREEKKQKKKNT